MTNTNPKGVPRVSLATYEREVKELTENKIAIEHVTETSLNSTRRMIQLVDQCQNIGGNTLQMLKTQGESLNRTENALDITRNNIQESEKTVRKMEILNKVPWMLTPCYFWCCARKNVKNKKPKKGNEMSKQHNYAKTNVTRLTLSENAETTMNFISQKPGKTQISEKPSNVTNSNDDNDVFWSKKEDAKAESAPKKIRRSLVGPSRAEKYLDNLSYGDTKENEIYGHLEHVSSYLTVLRNQASLMNATVIGQNTQIDRLNEKAGHNRQKLMSLTTRSKHLTDN